ncbi:hypothetical protein Cpap_0516 [Ruminiclostridium papyrosolvens DSM 2782]|uniref:PQ loop repeat protein n=1 Tax=Ruminiclostridium papyrosolvens DSM 2782 TaxID=588581 RepID=F1THY0_9FIRM|nr:PQ-loop domain-containing transporter [Ruminiclostridium papyrosolvens]EGD45915.1 hypothetical protein Cpap_0516 [Ruminiclostridium papyrosolvens DSM 2782]WES33695.1 PQ-loop domain-containing transporter [Ruminiclostridium papyrosolvens DSM 2782]
MSIFEALMLLSFGAAWPAQIYRSYKSRKTAGKSIAFLYILIFGYLCGITNKILYQRDIVLALYIINLFMVSTDICLYYRNKKIEKTENQ